MDKPKNPFNETFAINFIGQEMEFMLNIYHRSEGHNEEGVLIQQNPMAVRGYVLDIDEEFVYLGDTPNGINRFVRKDLIAGGDIVNPDKENDFDDILNNFSGSSN